MEYTGNLDWLWYGDIAQARHAADELTRKGVKVAVKVGTATRQMTAADSPSAGTIICYYVAPAGSASAGYPAALRHALLPRSPDE